MGEWKEEQSEGQREEPKTRNAARAPAKWLNQRSAVGRRASGSAHGICTAYARRDQL